MLKPERLPRRRYDQFIDLLLGRRSGLFADTPSIRIDRQNTELRDYWPFDGKQARYCLEHDEFLFSQLAMERELIGLVPSAWGVDPQSSLLHDEVV
jgi:hypothetical protein